MAVNVGTLTIDLKANTASFSQSMDKMSQLSAKTATDISRSLQKIAVAGVAAVGAISAGLTAMVHSAFESIDAMDKLAQSTGTTTETLSLLQYAAALSNVETEQLSVSLAKLAKAEFQASTGNVEMARVFKKLGVDVQDSNKKLIDTGITYEHLAVKFAQMADGPVKTALAIQLFGKAGAAQIPLLNQLGAEFEKIQKEAEQFGLIVGTDVAKLTGDAHDQVDRLHQVVKGLGYSILSAVLPALSKLIDQLIEIAKHADIPGLAKSFGDSATKAITAFGDALVFATKHATALKAALEALAAVQLTKVFLPFIAGLASGGWEKAGAGIAKFATNLFGLQKVLPILANFGKWATGIVSVFTDLIATEGVLTTATYALETAFAAMGGWVTVIIAAVVGLGVAIYKLRDATFTFGDSSYKVRDTWNAAWIIIGNGFKWVGAKFSEGIAYIKNLWKSFVDWIGSNSVIGPIVNQFVAAFSAIGRFLGHLAPQFVIDALNQAKREREAAEKAAKATSTSTKDKSGGKKKDEGDTTGLGKPQADPYGEAIKKLNLAIAAQQSYLAVLHGTPEAIANVTAAEKAEALILEINTKLKEKDKSLTASQEAEIRARVAKEESTKALVDYGKELVQQQKSTELSIAQTATLTAAYNVSDEAVRRVTVSNAILGLTMGKTQAEINAMRGDLLKLQHELDDAADRKALEEFNRTLTDQQRQLALSTAQARTMAYAYDAGDKAVQQVEVDMQILAITFGKSDAEIKAMSASLAKLKSMLLENRAALAAESARRDLESLRDEAEQQHILAAAIFGTIDAQRQAAIQAKVLAIDRQIAAATDKDLIAILQAERAQIIANMQAEFGMADAQEALNLRSPAEQYAKEMDALQHQTEALAASQNGMLTYGQQMVIAAKQQDAFNKATDETVNLLLKQTSAKAGVEAFFLDMQKEAITTAKIIYDALHATFEKLSDNLTELITGGKADFAAMFRDIGKMMVKESIQQALQRTLASIGEKLGISLGGKPDGSSPGRAIWVKIAGTSAPLPTAPSQAPAQTGGGGIFGGGWLGGMVWSVIGGRPVSSPAATPPFLPVGGRAEGGIVSPDRAYVVGERGPEILMMGSTQGNVISNDRSRRLMMGGENPSVHYYTIDARGTDPVLTEQRTRTAIISAHNSAIMTSTRVQQERAARTPNNLGRR